MSRLVTSLSPNAERDDIRLAASLLLQPWKWQTGPAITDLEQALGHFFHTQAITFESGRSALTAAIHALNLPKNSEIILQAFTCVAVPNSIRWADCIPIYADVDPNTFTIDPSAIETLITPNTRAILIQHTFGIPAHMDTLIELARKHKLLVIEDCAHSFGSRWNGQLLGTFGDVAIFSFGRDKSLSSIFGGVALTRDISLANRLRSQQTQAPISTKHWVLQQLLHPLTLALSLKTYDTLSFGKIILEVSKRLHLISKAVEPQERQGTRPTWTGRRLPNALALLALHQWKKRERFDAHRRTLTRIYQQELKHPDIIHPNWAKEADPALLRYPIRTPKRDILFKAATSAKMQLGDWYTSPLAPEGTNEQAAHYDRTQTPNAVTLSKDTLNLPTHINISKSGAKKICTLIKTTLNQT
ncbi:aminotransferase class I/II-fold pyridoxal phosphate-dependent enzyme [Patescibacteria group bacterium]|nr:aminotransferase class I/II-fold pyridoxal phosphate-dependent enzyme [Patescibacteria group bacterium]MBP9710136.1 aminotransferase class I/II-fold pyridoxal phosphate-dependent enzyme [Patescibacteria group bacterium]